MIGASLFLLAALSAPQQPQAPPMTMEKANAILRADDGDISDMTRQMEIANFDMHFAICEIAWHRAPIWTRAAKYHFHDPCKKEIRGLNSK
jgi:hypothetical protein